MTVSPGTRLGPYEVIGLLATGGMGEVYRARDDRLGRDVAIKVLPAAFSGDPDRLRRFEQEARAAGSLNHPNIVTIYDIGTHNGSPYVVQELLEGETLRERLKQGPLATRKAIDFARQIGRGLAAAHDKGITHRDLKPDNTFLTDDGRAKILDFGLAKLTERVPEESTDADRPTISDRLTAPGVVLGTVGYMSPEQVRGHSVDHRADVFSFGVILYEMLQGERAFGGDSDVEIMHSILKDEPLDLAETNPKLGPALARVVRHCLEKDPRERFHSAHDLAFALDALSATDPSAVRTALAEKPPRSLRLAAALILGGVALGTLLWVFASSAIRGLFSGPPPTFRKLAFRRGVIPAARFHPDGQTIIYGAAWEGRPVELYTTRIDAPESRPLGIPNAGVLAIGGEIAISMGCQFQAEECQGTLAQVPLSGGAPREVLENVRHADWGPDGKSMLVVRAMEGSYRLEYPIGKVLYQTPGWICDTRFSPAGDRIALLEHPTLGVVTNGLVSVIDLAGKKKTLSSGWKDLRGLGWRGPDEIWFTAGQVAGQKALYSVTLGGRQRLVLRTPGNPVLLDLSRDGRRVLLSRAEPRTEILFLASGAALERDMSWFDSSWTGDLTPDGKTLLFTEWGEAVGSEATVYMRKTDGSDAVRLGRGRALAMSPDERWVLAVEPSTPPQLVLLPTRAGQPKTLPRGEMKDFWWASWFRTDGESCLPGRVPSWPVRLRRRLLGASRGRSGRRASWETRCRRTANGWPDRTPTAHTACSHWMAANRPILRACR